MSDGLYKRGKIWWLRSDPVTEKRISTGCRGKEAALAFRADRERLALDPNYSASHTATVGKWAAELLRVKRATKSAGTLDMYQTKIGHVLRVFGADMPMVDVNPKNVDRYVSQRQSEKAGNNTIGKELIAIVQMAKLAQRGGEFSGEVSALRPVSFDGSSKAGTTTLSRAQVEKLFAALPPARAALLALAVATGARRSEVQRIRPEDISLSEWTVRIAGTKTEGSDRHIPIPLPAQRALLRAALESGCLPAKWINMSADLPALCEEIELPRATPNDLRRSFATWSIEAGVSREDVAKLMGHRSTAMVFRHYGRESAEALGKKLSRELGTEPSHHELCSGGPKRLSACFYGVSDGDRTRDNRSHNPPNGSGTDPSNALFPVDSRFGVAPNTTESLGVRTDPSQPARYLRLASWAWFNRRAAA
jgi:integrase